MILYYLSRLRWLLGSVQIIPFVSLGDDFIRTTEEFPEVPTTANRSTKNNDIHITGEPLPFIFGCYVLLTQEIFIEYHLPDTVPIVGHTVKTLTS